jgi:hypothetical protein
MKHSGERFPGLKLKDADRDRISELKKLGALRERDWRRIRILELLDAGWNLTDTGGAVGTYPREVRRVGWRYVERGLEAALTDEPRPMPSRMLDHGDESAIIAMVCSAPPDGHARWSVRLIAQEARKRGIVKKIERESVRRLLTRHELKPWREKNVVRSEAGPRIHPADGGRAEHVGDAAGRGGSGGRPG